MDNKLIYNKAASLATASDRESYKEMNFIYKFIKRVLDIVCSILGIIVLSPILVIVSILIKLESKGPIIFKQLRAGKGSKPFYIYKFRSMKIETPNIATNDFTDSHVYITRIGKIIRKTSIDEIPQLFNILKGDMSIVGPRPLLTQYLPLYSEEQKKRHDVRPGLTGWAQINGRNSITWTEKFKLDVWYVKNRNFLLDLKIIFLTVKKVIIKEGINQDNNVTMEYFNGTN